VNEVWHSQRTRTPLALRLNDMCRQAASKWLSTSFVKAWFLGWPGSKRSAAPSEIALNVVLLGARHPGSTPATRPKFLASTKHYGDRSSWDRVSIAASAAATSVITSNSVGLSTAWQRTNCAWLTAEIRVSTRRDSEPERV